MPSAIPAISDPAPRPRIAWRTTCFQSMVSPTAERRGGAAAGGPAFRREDVVLAPELERRRRAKEAGDPLELPCTLVLEELRLVVARGRLGRVLAAIQARRAEGLRALEALGSPLVNFAAVDVASRRAGSSA